MPMSRRALLTGAASLAVPVLAGAGPAGVLRRRRAPTSGIALLRAVDGASDGDVIVLDPSVSYVVPRGLRLTASGVSIDGDGAVLRLSDGAPQGDDRLLTIRGSGNLVTRVHFAGRRRGERAVDETRTVALEGRRNTVERCTVTTTAGTAIGVASGSDHVIRANSVSGGGGILYGWADVDRTRCEDNVVRHARGNGVGGVGNGGRPTSGHIVRGNRIEASGRFGIEDYGAIRRTRIEGNTIVDSRLMGISAVGQQSRVIGNHLRNPGSQNGIEAGSAGTHIHGNVVQWDVGRPGRGRATGIIVNGGSAGSRQDVQLAGNRVTGAGIGLDLAGRLTRVTSRRDRFVNCGLRAINAAPAAADDVLIDQADIVFSAPSRRGVDLRDGVSVAGIDTVRITRSRITFEPTTAGGGAQDFFVRIDRDRVTITDCVFDGGGRMDARRALVGNASGARIGSAVVEGNRLLRNARIQTGTFVRPSLVASNSTG